MLNLSTSRRAAPALRLRGIVVGKCIKPNAFGNALGSSLAEANSGVEKSTYQRNPMAAIGVDEIGQWGGSTSTQELLDGLPAVNMSNSDAQMDYFLNGDKFDLNKALNNQGGVTGSAKAMIRSGAISDLWKAQDAVTPFVSSGEHRFWGPEDDNLGAFRAENLTAKAPNNPMQEEVLRQIQGSFLRDYGSGGTLPSTRLLQNLVARGDVGGPSFRAWDGNPGMSLNDRIVNGMQPYSGGTLSTINYGIVGLLGGSNEAAAAAGAFAGVTDSIAVGARFVPSNKIGVGPRIQPGSNNTLSVLNRLNAVESSEVTAARLQLKTMAMIEPQVTQTLSGVAANNGGEMLGLQYRLKSVDSLARKMADQPGIPINDALRYTMSFDELGFTEGAQKTMAVLQEQGYQRTVMRNTFKDGQPYKGINTTYLTPEGQMFELQFHTPTSFQMKDVINHPLYEQQRILPNTDPTWVSLRNQMIQNSSSVPNPPGVTSIKKNR